jgi:hypothetical protein
LFLVRTGAGLPSSAPPTVPFFSGRYRQASELPLESVCF